MNLDEVEAEVDEAYRKGKIGVAELVDLTTRVLTSRTLTQPRPAFRVTGGLSDIDD